MCNQISLSSVTVSVFEEQTGQGAQADVPGAFLLFYSSISLIYRVETQEMVQGSRRHRQPKISQLQSILKGFLANSMLLKFTDNCFNQTSVTHVYLLHTILACYALYNNAQYSITKIELIYLAKHIFYNFKTHLSQI